MRVAVALPSLPAGTPVRSALDAVVAELPERDLEVEVFGEMERVREGAPVPIYHYLRFRERHARRPFDRAIWPLGRDARVWEAAWMLSRRFHGIVWVLDGPLHHLILGGVAVPGLWSEYARLAASGLGRDGDRGLGLFAAGWGTRAACRLLDPVPSLLQGRAQLLVADGSLGAELSRVGGTVAGVVPLPVLPAPASAAGPEGRTLATAISVDVVQPRRLLAAIAAVLDRHPSLRVQIAIPEPTYHVRVAPAAHAAGVLGRIDWLLSPDPAVLRREVDRSEIVLLLDVDATAADHALLVRALALGKAVIALEARRLREIPEPPLIKLAAGTRLGPGLSVALDSVVADDGLRRGLGEAGRRWCSGRPGPEAVVEQLLERLRDGPPLAAAGAGRSAAWPSIRAGALERSLPAAAAPSTRSLVEEVLDGIFPADAKPPS